MEYENDPDDVYDITAAMDKEAHTGILLMLGSVILGSVSGFAAEYHAAVGDYSSMLGNALISGFCFTSAFVGIRQAYHASKRIKGVERSRILRITHVNNPLEDLLDEEE